jgi:hypothetical protein
MGQKKIKKKIESGFFFISNKIEIANVFNRTVAWTGPQSTHLTVSAVSYSEMVQNDYFWVKY